MIQPEPNKKKMIIRKYIRMPKYILMIWFKSNSKLINLINILIITVNRTLCNSKAHMLLIYNKSLNNIYKIIFKITKKIIKIFNRINNFNEFIY